jgi:hypothetical protein
MTGLFCEVCGTEIKNLRFLKTCRKCQKILCSLCAQRFYIPSRDFIKPRSWKQRIPLQYEEVCSDCYEKLEGEKVEADDKIDEEQEPPKPITTCELCGSNDEPPRYHIFGYTSPTFFRCCRCGKLACDVCTSSPPEGHYEYDLVCRQCCDALEAEDSKSREEAWRAAEEEKAFEE